MIELWQIYERSKFSNEVGAAIHVCPNAARILSQWQFDFERADAVVVREVVPMLARWNMD